MNTETLDKLYLEYSQNTKARTGREIEYLSLIDSMTKEMESMTKAMDDCGDLMELVTEKRALICSASWIPVEDPPKSAGWYLGFFSGAARCIGYDSHGWGFWGVPCDERPEFLTHWMPIPDPPAAQNPPPPQNPISPTKKQANDY